ncbi:MAG: hypothetical protein A3J63_01835 [Candidatus Moranbacteria bacterium RIFCSPHIGHO2_02_FULL_40_12b]|nr:MAG: hypothetical protein A3J63_01835 [Candidatus Moranbacteria bacterium RIFCSPHIGHO2_02_FULL_40_12b]OGI23468.1 MAG: hypothetical protein A3E91_01630 [Candidatus Moranbacteria bacterium RIFCSPHIGHO2_12_FULL_40_10]
MKFFVNTNDLLLTLTKDQAVQITGTGTEPACATANTAVLAYNTTVNLLCYCLNGSGTWKDIKDGISACGTW